MALPRRVDVALICGGQYHDMDYARLELLQHCAAWPQLRVRVAENYDCVPALDAAQCLLTYTCNVVPSDSQRQALERLLARGGRWFALHGTNSLLAWSREHKAWFAPRSAPEFMTLLGSQFIAHPPIAPYRVDVSDPDHELVRGLEPFETDDELYLCEYHGDHHALLHTEFRGAAPGFVEHDWSHGGRQLVLYLRRVGGGEVLYCTLGHCRGQYDMQPLMAEYPQIERGSWKLPAFHEIVRRGIRWAARL
ncbi:MAG: ThuA domain-containing protein [Steroidobacteraceae bacterium]|nr:ThuA domain-containing protein [Steroidobacteraceae bacterium]MDW8258881.1 ThuA domain-containing protein [Gammaproteobacteria bacterium]